MLDVTARVCSDELDRTHELEGGFVASTGFHIGRQLPVDGGADALRPVLWDATTQEIRDAQGRWLRVRANPVVEVEDTDPSDDFSRLAEPAREAMPRSTSTSPCS